MVATFHNHTTFCDGKSTPREMIEFALEKGCRAIGFSSHGYTPFDLRYCMKDQAGYVKEVNSLKKEFEGRIEVYLGIEEDAFAPVNRSLYDYVIGSSHYYFVDGVYYPIDSSPAHFDKCLEALNYNVPLMAEKYFSAFTNYILERKPDIIGHFDVITKFDETSRRFLDDKEYHKIAEKYTSIILDKTECIFELNVGAMIRGYRFAPYPHFNLLNLIKKSGGEVILALDCHNKEILDFDFTDILKELKNIGFTTVRTLKGGKFVKENI